MKSPAQIASMAELRAEIDLLDAALVAALADRARLIDRAAELKRAEGMAALVPERVAEVLAHVRSEAVARGLDPALAEALWRQIIDWAIAREEEALARGKDA
ncbi:MAG: chorismate mutase [Phaeovulum sp.]|uniref:chorismate mutase n=1 Tax=Phaeovulum sp. TaxID=2934796 RepID=UPI002732298F|nr:chorismate mutase [Phaeovulum sp.]MDP2063688.1 chorismate mutase [Phaeovulum sp.]MDP3860432.1 chorismate mutase [Phaeovulum sp.]